MLLAKVLTRSKCYDVTQHYESLQAVTPTLVRQVGWLHHWSLPHLLLALIASNICSNTVIPRLTGIPFLAFDSGI